MKIADSYSLQIYLNWFNKAVTDLLSVDIKLEEDDKTLLFIRSLIKSS